MSDIESKTAFVFGCGYLGMRVAKRLISAGWHVSAMTRTPEKARRLAKMGINPIIGDWTDRRTLGQVPVAQRVLFAVGYDGQGGYDRHAVYVEGLSNALHVVRPESQVVYISTTGVYHQSAHVWVDESSPTRPAREGGQAHLRAENLLRRRRSSEPQGGRTVVLRMAGLYGPGRVPRWQTVLAGQPMQTEPDSYLNLIHIEDAADCVMAAWDLPCGETSPRESLYVVSDGTPVLRRDFYAEIAHQLRVDPPQLLAGAGGRSEGSKRIWNRRMRRDLLPRLSYPSYREGLRALCWQGGKP